MKSRSRIIKALKKLHPHVEWRCERWAYISWHYLGDNGWEAHWVAALAPRYDGDDETYVRQFYIYKTSTNEMPERVWI